MSTTPHRNPKPHWVIEDEVFDASETNALIEELKKQNIDHTLVPYGWYRKCRIDGPDSPVAHLNAATDDDISNCVLYRGSIDGAQLVTTELDWTPGVYCNLSGLSFRRLLEPLGDLLLNHDCLLVPVGKLMMVDYLNQLLEQFNTDRLFVRPNSGGKQFTGQIVTRDTHTRFAKELSASGLSGHDLTVVASVKPILIEGRCLVVNSEFSIGSFYNAAKVQFTKSKMPELINIVSSGMAQTVQKAAQRYNPLYDSAFIIDVAAVLPTDAPAVITDVHIQTLTYKVVEYNSFSCAALYTTPLS